MKDKIKAILLEDYGYSERVAEMRANDLCSFKDKDLQEAVRIWLSTGKYMNVTEGTYQTRELVEKHSMKYPAALAFIARYRKCPAEAEASLFKINNRGDSAIPTFYEFLENKRYYQSYNSASRLDKTPSEVKEKEANNKKNYIE